MSNYLSYPIILRLKDKHYVVCTFVLIFKRSCMMSELHVVSGNLSIRFEDNACHYSPQYCCSYCWLSIEKVPAATLNKIDNNKVIIILVCIPLL